MATLYHLDEGNASEKSNIIEMHKKHIFDKLKNRQIVYGGHCL